MVNVATQLSLSQYLTVEISVVFEHYSLRCLDLVHGNRPPPLTTVWQWDQLSYGSDTDDSPLQFRAVLQDFDYITSHAEPHTLLQLAWRRISRHGFYWNDTLIEPFGLEDIAENVMVRRAHGNVLWGQKLKKVFLYMRWCGRLLQLYSEARMRISGAPIVVRAADMSQEHELLVFFVQEPSMKDLYKFIKRASVPMMLCHLQFGVCSYKCDPVIPLTSFQLVL